MGDAVQQIKDRLNILDVISPYVELHKAGKNYKGKSPFSAEKTPSFYVSPDRGMYYCFSTSQGGDMFTFIQVMEGVDFKEALKVLAQKAGVELIPEKPEKRTERERSYAALQTATDFYKDWLEREPAARAYVGTRGVSDETIQKWQIGFAPGPPTYGWRMLKDHLEKYGYSKDELLKVGLIKSTEGGKEPFDVFRDRIMFPLFDTSGKVVAFSGRILSKGTDAPKYVNSPETELYKKSELLYGYDKAKHGIRHYDFSLIVEGQFDVVMCHQAGYTNTVAVSGTALTSHHVDLLARLSERVVLALDADKAGIAAMKRAADLMLHRGLDVKVAVLPDGQDPADAILESKEKFKVAVGKSVHVIEFLLATLKSAVSDERSLKLKVRDEVLPFILLLPNRIDQEHFVQVVAKEIHTTDDAIRFELDRLREQPTAVPRKDIQTDVALVSVRTGSVVQNHLTYLQAVMYLVDKPHTDALKATLDEISARWKIEEANTEAVAETTFTLERQFEHLAPTLILEEILARLNTFRKVVVKREVTTLREELAAAEAGEDESLVGEILTRLQIAHKELQKPPFDSSLWKASAD